MKNQWWSGSTDQAHFVLVPDHRPLTPYFNATTNAVTTKFAMASGNKNFHPNAINWS